MGISDNKSPREAKGIGRRCYASQARKTANAVLRAYNDWLKPVELEMAQFITMAAIFQDDAGSIGELAEIMGVERTTLVRNLKVLEKRGLVKVAARTQRRLIHELTSEGASLLARALPLWEQAQATLETTLAKTQVKDVRDVREALRDLYRALPVAFAVEEEAAPEALA